ncbi:hypothetical protein LUZ60_005579 [Juncus effusus]|nr:hypothetical protein LUZ60_005579 [Juncus effusus]
MSLAAIMALESVLRSKGNMSKWEREVVSSSISRATGDFLLGATVSFATVFSTFWAIPRTARVFISGYAGLTGGKWTAGRKLESQIDKLLGLQGTRIQSELATLILTEFKNDKSLVKLVRKQYYAEQVYGDINPDISLFRWRPRNLYVESQNNENFEKIDQNKSSESKIDKPQSNSTVEKYSDVELFVDPFECLFGCLEGENKEMLINQMNQSDLGQNISKKQIRAQKRAHRRRKSQNSDEMK